MAKSEPRRESGLTESDASGSDGDGRQEKISWRPSFSVGLILKILFLGGVNAFFLAGLPAMVEQQWWLGLSVMGIATALIDWAYLSKRSFHLKYLVPGTIFALAFQIVPVLYSGYISLTNSSIAHRLTQEQVIDQLSTRTSNVPGGTRYELTLLSDGSGGLAFHLINDDGTEYLGTQEGLEELAAHQVARDPEGDVEAVDGFTALGIREISDRQAEITGLEIPTDDGVIKATTLTSAAIYLPLYRYDEETGYLTHLESGTEYKPVEGRFTSDAGETLRPGWETFVGLENYTRVFTNEAIRGPFLRVLIWNYAFALGSVFLTFVLGLGLALTLNHPGMRGQKTYRAFLIIPYALPSFMTALLWAGMLNQDFGVINRIFDADIPWLRDPTMAKASILLVNTWLGFPYMFLLSLGALQAIPSELKEAALVDGASIWQSFRNITFPLLMVALAPLLIASFAFNFNNFNVIFLLNEGGPPIEGAATPAGHTDILISYTYRLAFESGSGADWGFASAISVLIFIMVATVSAISFRRTRALEEVAG